VSEVDPDLALLELQRILDLPQPWSRPCLVIANMSSSFATPFFWFGGNFIDAIIAAGVGGFVTCFGFIANDHPIAFGNVYAMLCAFIAGFVATLAGPDRCQTAISFCAIIWLIPG
jgi:uncharacterized membrane protein YjjP (DUF1212 family)